MIKLIRLEWKTNRIGRYIRNAVIMTVALFAFSLLTAPEMSAMDTVAAYGRSMMSAMVDLLTHMAYMIFTGVMLATFIVGAYENRTMNLLFSYPVKRKKILAAKMLAVWIFNYVALVISKLAIYAGLFATSSVTHISASDIRLGGASFYLNILISSGVMVSISFIALLIGMKLHSSKTVIVAAVILTLFTQGNIGEFTLSGSVPFYGVLMLLSIAAVALLVSDVEKRDVM